VLAEVFENEAAELEVGQDAQVELHGAQPASLTGKVDFVFPTVDPRTRRIKVRIALKNPGDAFKPASYVTVVLGTTPGRKLSIPKEAVIDNGDRQYALLALPDGYFQPRDIKVGPAGDEHYAVIEGLKEGDRVVTSAQFLIDSETNLAAAMKAMSMSMPGMDMGEGQEMEGTEGMEGAEGKPGHEHEP
jgi:Cu(I)/Ag(I) efflux system membrane fusion protein